MHTAFLLVLFAAVASVHTRAGPSPGGNDEPPETPADCTGTDCGFGCCPYESWFCCPEEKFSCAFYKEDCADLDNATTIAPSTIEPTTEEATTTTTTRRRPVVSLT